ncbi:hypothetical protein [Desulfosporosinus sp. SB140]|uniref:hypothetical protein n=1 Tax=Desulfosporosinus paludis TaxID=3115649 RepID=UPI00388CEDE6
MASRNAKGRMIYWKISYSKQLVRCSLLSKLLFTWLIPNTDDLGRMEGDPEVIKGMVFPYEDKISVKQIRESLEELDSEKLILWYRVEDNLYIQFPNFAIYQTLRKDRVYKSDYPGPEDVAGRDMTSHDKSGHDGQNMREGEGKEKVSEGEGEGKESKTCFAPHVTLTQDEYSKLVKQHGEDDTKQLIEILENYKAANGKKYKSDYHAILNWVVKRFAEEKARSPDKAKPGVPSGKYDEFYM